MAKPKPASEQTKPETVETTAATTVVRNQLPNGAAANRFW